MECRRRRWARSRKRKRRSIAPPCKKWRDTDPSAKQEVIPISFICHIKRYNVFRHMFSDTHSIFTHSWLAVTQRRSPRHQKPRRKVATSLCLSLHTMVGICGEGPLIGLSLTFCLLSMIVSRIVPETDEHMFLFEISFETVTMVTNVAPLQVSSFFLWIHTDFSELHPIR